MRKFLLTLCTLLAACCSFAFVACGEDTDPVCEHEYIDEYTCHDRVCTKCGEVLPATTDHIFSETVTKATCTQDGYTTFICACGFTKKGNETNALGHDFSVLKEEIQPVTCTEPGEAVYQCSRCDEIETKFTPALGHTADPDLEKVVAPTCTERGYTEHTCKTCKTKYQDTYLDATGHTPNTELDRVVVPTCTDKGYTEHTCEICQETYRDTEISAFGHNFEVLESEETATCEHPAYERRKCSRCDKEELKIFEAKTAHVFDEQANCTLCGKYVTEVFAIAVNERFEDTLQYAKADETFGYIVYAEPNAGSNWYRINIDRATLEALVREGLGRLTFRFGNPDANTRTFNWMIEGDASPTAGNNFTPNGYNDTCSFTLSLTDENGVWDLRINEDYGLNIYVAYNGLSGQVDNFAFDIVFGKLGLASDPATQVGLEGEGFTTIYDSETSRWTINGIDLAVKDNFKLWISEAALSSIRKEGLGFLEITLSAKEGQGLSISYDGVTPPVAGNQSLTFRVELSAKGDLWVQTIYMGHFIPDSFAAPDGFHLTIRGVDSLTA